MTHITVPTRGSFGDLLIKVAAIDMTVICRIAQENREGGADAALVACASVNSNGVSEREQRQNRDGQDNGAEHDERLVGGRGFEKWGYRRTAELD